MTDWFIDKGTLVCTIDWCVYCRLWCVPREDDFDNGQIKQIGYINVVPSLTDNGQFNSFGETVFKFNQYLRQKPIPGLTITPPPLTHALAYIRTYTQTQDPEIPVICLMIKTK